MNWEGALEFMDVKNILIARGIRATRSLGQYFLIDEDVASRMVDYAGVDCCDVVLEIGAGVGSVTEKLVRRAKKVYAVEKDKELCEVLRERYRNKNKDGGAEIIEGDIMKIELPRFDKVVASIPFSLSSAITYKLLLHNHNNNYNEASGLALAAVLLYQKEFAKKLVARPRSDSYSRISVISQALARIEILELVHRDAFYPPSPVKTTIVRLKAYDYEEQTAKSKSKAVAEEKEEGIVAMKDRKKFFEFVTTAFEQRRKKMGSIFKTRLLRDSRLVSAELDKRPEELSPDEFVRWFSDIEVGGHK